jgi:hypothetical protein
MPIEHRHPLQLSTRHFSATDRAPMNTDFAPVVQRRFCINGSRAVHFSAARHPMPPARQNK